jgi:GT2 family glycosyltransferase
MALEKNNIYINNQSIIVIIISYNKIDSVIKAIRSIIDYYNMHHFIIIDNSENSYFFENLKMNLNKIKALTLIKNPQNYGFAKAVNQGIEIAMKDNNCKYILLLNDDAYVDKDCISKLIDALEKDEKALLAGPTICYGKSPNTVWSAGGYFDNFLSRIRIPLKNKNITIEELDKIPIQEVDFLTGCVLLIKREAIEKVGFFDEAFFFYSEDLDYCFRVKKAGYKCLWVPSSIAWHDIEMSARFSSPFAMYNLAKSGIIVRKKHFTGLLKLWNVLIFISLHTLNKFLSFILGKSNFSAIKAWVKGIVDGLKYKIQQNKK